jgi:uncharacterized membrane protein YjfL (UPF0719 family)
MFSPFLAIWAPETLFQWVGSATVFTALGVAAMILAVLVFDKLHPIDFAKEIGEHKNMAAAVVLAAIIIGVAMVVSRVVGA